MPSKETYKRLKNKNIDLGIGASERYNKYDTLAGKDDLSALFETLNSVQDSNGNPAVITAVSLTSNPNFDKIKHSNYNEYFFEPFTQTLERYNHSNILNLWAEGKNAKVFIPEFHGREHLNVATWMRALKNKDQDTLVLFENQCWGFKNKNQYNINYQAAFDLEYEEDLDLQKEIIKSGLDEFEQLHSSRARYFVPPNGPINNSLLQSADLKGIELVCTAKVQVEPLGRGETRKKYHWMGKRSKWGQRFITRNASFEPSANGKDWVDSCLKDIFVSFQLKKPAVISSHRVNFIGQLDSKNRDKGIGALGRLLNLIIKTWPDVEFHSTSSLGDIIKGSDDRID